MWASTSSSPSRSGRLSPAALALLALTATISLTWSHFKLLDQDELFVLQTDTVPTLRDLLHIQLHTPISLDPLVYHALAHWSTCLFGANAFALRLPSLAGFLLMQVCLYVFVRRCLEQSRVPHPSRFMGRVGPPLQPDTAALLVMALPAITATLFYSAEARPYGLLLGFSALTLMAWQFAVTPTRHNSILLSEAMRSQRTPPNPASPQPSANSRDEPLSTLARSPRSPALLTLTLALALALNTHYFSILLLIPLCLAELVRAIQARRLDLPTAAAIAAGVAAEAFTLPFQHAAAAFRLHYYNAGTIGLHTITQSYRALLVDYTRAPIAAQRLADAAFVLLALALVVATSYRRTTRTLALTRPEFTFTVTLAALPFFGFLLGYFVTHTLEIRYVLATILGISILVALTLAPGLRTPPAQRAAAALIFAAVALTGLVRIVEERRRTSETLTAMRPSSALQAALAVDPDAPVYIQEMGHFETLSYYEPDLTLRRRLTLVYSADDEIRFRRHDTEALTAEHMTHFPSLPGIRITRYEDLKQQPGDHLFLLYQGGWNWTGPAFDADHAALTPLGPAMDGQAATVRFR